MHSHFMNGFAAELTKEAKYPISRFMTGFAPAAAMGGAGALGSIAGMKMDKTSSLRNRKGRAAKNAGRAIGKALGRAGAGLARGTGRIAVDAAGGAARGTARMAVPLVAGGYALANPEETMRYAEELVGALKKTSSLKNLKGKKAPTFTSNTKGGKIGNPTENPERFGTGGGCDPKYGCGKGKHGTGCGMRGK